MDDESQQGAKARNATRWHVVQKGETLSTISEHYYGDANLSPKIFDANRDVLMDPKLVQTGQKIRIP